MGLSAYLSLHRSTSLKKVESVVPSQEVIQLRSLRKGHRMIILADLFQITDRLPPDKSPIMSPHSQGQDGSGRNIQMVVRKCVAALSSHV